MKVVILAGGYGTRIRDVAEDIPKPMIPIGDFPILWHIMKIYSYYGHKEFIICLGYKASIIKNFFMNYQALTRDFTINLGTNEIKYTTHHDEQDWNITLVDTGLNSMTGSRISKIKRFVGEEQFLLTYGDGVSDVNINEIIKFHNQHGKTLTVTGVRPPGRFGEMGATEDGMINEFNEKPQATGGRISGGFFVANPTIFDYLTDDESLVFEQAPMRNMVKNKELMMYSHDGFWQPMDTSREFQLLNDLYKNKNATWIK